MSTSSAPDVMKLRAATNMPVHLCKEALIEAGGDFEKAKDIIRQKTGAVAVDQPAGTNGLILVHRTEKWTTIVEVRTQTDFAARSELVIKRLSEVSFDVDNNGLPDVIRELNAQTGELITVPRMRTFRHVPGRQIETYVHHDRSIGVVLEIDQGDGMAVQSSDTLRKICMHIAGVEPRALATVPGRIPQSLIDGEQRFLEEKAKASGKSAEIQAKIVQGGIAKFVNERSLISQPFVLDTKVTVGSLLTGTAKVSEFVRWEVGEKTV